MILSETLLYQKNLNKDTSFNMLMAYPGPKSFALSSLGFMWLYKDLDENTDINIVPVYLDSPKTLINSKKLDLIAFSMSFDMDIFNVFKILDMYKIPLKSVDRDDNSPLIFAGGPVITSNPIPYKEFFDFFVIGDGEVLNRKVACVCKDNSEKSKLEILKILAEIEGIYVPSVNQKCVKKVTEKLHDCIYTPIISDEAYFKNTFIIEVERGCANRCGFCLASYINLPIRFVPVETILKTIDLGLQYTNNIALLGAEVTAHPKFDLICRYIYDKIKAGQDINMSISSMRADSFTPDVVKTLVASGQRTSTIAIEAGSERLRRVINKNLSEEQIFNAVDVAYNNGLKGLKFYGMLGIPTETQADIDELINLTRRIKAKYKGFEISFGFSSFVPKPHTPFQWVGKEDTKSLEKKQLYLKKELHKLGVNAQFSSVKWDYYQAVLSRGNENLTEFILEVYKNNFSAGAFKNAAKKFDINLDYYAIDTYNTNANLPWDIITIQPGKEFLQKEYIRLISG